MGNNRLFYKLAFFRILLNLSSMVQSWQKMFFFLKNKTLFFLTCFSCFIHALNSFLKKHVQNILKTSIKRVLNSLKHV